MPLYTFLKLGELAERFIAPDFESGERSVLVSRSLGGEGFRDARTLQTFRGFESHTLRQLFRTLELRRGTMWVPIWLIIAICLWLVGSGIEGFMDVLIERGRK